MPWIMLIKKLPTNPSPPKMSIFWAEERPDHQRALEQFKRYKDDYDLERYSHEERMSFWHDQNNEKMTDAEKDQKVFSVMATCGHKTFFDAFGQDPNAMLNMAILYKDKEVTVLAPEYSIMTHKNMTEYIRESHVLVPTQVAMKSGADPEIFTAAVKEVFDAARVDGASDQVAMAMAYGVDITGISAESGALANYPAVGWYKCAAEYAQLFCYEDEMAE